jgi:hypothetical protein
MREMDYQTPQTGICKAENAVGMEPEHWPWPNEIPYTTPCQRSRIEVEAHIVNQQLQRIFAVLPNEAVNYGDDLPTSFARVETEIAKCISGCLTDVPPQKRDIAYVRSLLRDYKVVVPVRDGNPTVSLHRVHVILQDNFPGSCFCNLMNILLAGWMNTTTKVISFS